MKAYAIEVAGGPLPDEPLYSEPWSVETEAVVDGGSTRFLGESDCRCSPHRYPTKELTQAFIERSEEFIVYGYVSYGDVFGSPLRTMKFSKIMWEIMSTDDTDPLMMDWGGPKYTGQQEEQDSTEPRQPQNPN